MTQGTSRAASQEPITVTVENTKEIKDTYHLTEAEAIAQGYTVIKTAQDLQNISNNLSGKYMLMGDIDLSSLGTLSSSLISDTFKGTLDGNGYTISGLNIESTSNNVGLFKQLDYATVKNLYIENSSIKGNGDVGALAGYSAGAYISKVSVNADVTASSGNAGGIIGNAFESTIDQVQVSGNVVSHGTSSYVGGVVGYMYGDDYSGSNPTISNAYVNATVRGQTVGGIVGSIVRVDISNVFFEGQTNSYKTAGAIVGSIHANGTADSRIEYAFWNTDVTGNRNAYGTDIGNNTFIDDHTYGITPDVYESELSYWESTGIWDISGSSPQIKSLNPETKYTLTGATMPGLTADSVLSGYENNNIYFNGAEGMGAGITAESTDTVADILNKLKTKIEAAGHSFEWSISNGAITVTSDVNFNFSGPDNSIAVAMGLQSGTITGTGSSGDTSTPEASSDPISFTSNGTGTLDQSLGLSLIHI